jgi:hypothetical protein
MKSFLHGDAIFQRKSPEHLGVRRSILHTSEKRWRLGPVMFGDHFALGCFDVSTIQSCSHFNAFYDKHEPPIVRQ